MPTIPYASVLASVDSDTAVTGVRTVAGGNVIQLSGQNTAQWTQALWELADFPAGFPAPAGWSTDGNGVYYSTATTPPPFTVSQAYDRFGKYAVRLTVNNGLKAGVSDSEMVDESFMVLVKSPAGLESVSEFEEAQFGTSWAEALKRDAVTTEKAIGHSGATVATTDATATLLKSYAMTTNSRQYVLRCQVHAVGDVAVGNSALYDLAIVYTRSDAGVLTQRLATVTPLYETNAAYNVTATLNGSNLEIKGVGAAATNLRWHLTRESWLTLKY
jgi:hypothetical protein